MIAAILTALFIALFGGVSSYGKQVDPSVKDVQKKLEQTVCPNDRRAQTLSCLHEIENTTKGFNKKLNDTAADMAKHMKKHELTQKSLQDSFTALDASRQAALKKIFDQRFRMKDVLSRAEWDKIFGDQGS